MVESPKEPPNVEFGVAFPQPTVVRIKTESTQDIEQQQQQPTDETSAAVAPLAADIQEPIDVNIPRDTTNIFYAYEEMEVDNSFHEQQQQQSQSQQSALDTSELSQQAISPIEQPDQTPMPSGNSPPDTSNNSNNQSVNIEHENSTHTSDPSQSENQTTNSSSISSDNFRSSS